MVQAAPAHLDLGDEPVAAVEQEREEDLLADAPQTHAEVREDLLRRDELLPQDERRPRDARAQLEGCAQGGDLGRTQARNAAERGAAGL